MQLVGLVSNPDRPTGRAAEQIPGEQSMRPLLTSGAGVGVDRASGVA